MKPFAELTRRGKARRLRTLALRALEQYDIAVADLRLLGMYTNFLYRVRTVSQNGRGPSYVLRVCTPGWRTLNDIRSEAMWLQALDRDTDIGAPVPVPARDGTFVVHATANGVPGGRHCLLTSWLPGPLLATSLSEDNLASMGALFARLHAHGARWDPPHGFTERRMDREYARDEEDVLFACAEGYSPHTRGVLDRAWSVVCDAFDRLYADPAGLQVIHNDLHHENIKLDRRRLRPFDFEDTIWGYPVQDIAMALQDLMMDVAPEAYDPLLGAFRRGYDALAPWPEQYAGQIDTFRVGRMYWVANYVARYQRQYLREHIDWTAGYLERFLETGELRKARGSGSEK
jgi:Ser/Thr protein kinase RdoA (MazF antagonist)